MLFMFRVMENDDDGDPLNLGVVRAKDLTAALALVTEDMKTMVPADTRAAQHLVLPVRLYHLTDDENGEEGVLASGSYTDVYVDLKVPS